MANLLGKFYLFHCFCFGDISSFITVALISWLLLSFMVAFILVFVYFGLCIHIQVYRTLGSSQYQVLVQPSGLPLRAFLFPLFICGSDRYHKHQIHFLNLALLKLRG